MRGPQLSHQAQCHTQAPSHVQRPLHAAATVRRCCCRAQAQRTSVSTEAAHALLGIPPGSTKAEIRAAYIEQIKELHPDVNPVQDTTGPAADLNAAYSHLLEDMIINKRSRTAGSGAFKDVFDQPEAEPDCLFVNPFACSVDPLQWQELQDYARDGMARNVLLEDHLLAAGLAAPASAVNWLSPAQLAAVQQVLASMEERFDFEATAWSLDDMLRRARRANERLDIPLHRPVSPW